MSTMFEQNGYSIVTSLNERNIYIKCVDQINFTNYETNLDQKELRLQFDLSDIYNIINRCFDESEGYSVNFNVSSVSLKLTFNATVGGFLKVSFETLLREKILSNDGQLTTKINMMEQKYEALSKKFEKFIEKYEKTQEENLQLINAISNAEIILCPHNQSACHIFTEHIYKMNSISIVLECCSARFGPFGEPTLERICEFYQLKKLEINYSRFSNLNLMKNKTLEELKIDENNGCFTSIEGIDHFPNLRKIEIYNAPSLLNIVNVLSSFKNNIKTIILSKCPKINVIEIQTYCQDNNIQLNIS
jgi:hypothetical protein